MESLGHHPPTAQHHRRLGGAPQRDRVRPVGGGQRRSLQSVARAEQTRGSQPADPIQVGDDARSGRAASSGATPRSRDKQQCAPGARPEPERATSPALSARLLVPRRSRTEVGRQQPTRPRRTRRGSKSSVSCTISQRSEARFWAPRSAPPGQPRGAFGARPPPGLGAARWLSWCFWARFLPQVAAKGPDEWRDPNHVGSMRGRHEDPVHVSNSRKGRSWA